jgi:Holliday junction resolvase RusA-like endonuclease
MIRGMSTGTTLTITVIGKPQPQGSVKAFVPTHKGGAPVRRPDGSIVVNLTSDNPALKQWRDRVSDQALRAGALEPTPDVGFEVECTFFLERPKAHCGTGRNEGVVKDGAPAYPVVRPDADKLLRAVLDALTGRVWADDAQVVVATARKRYAAYMDHPGVSIVVRPLGAQTAREASDQLALA